MIQIDFDDPPVSAYVPLERLEEWELLAAMNPGMLDKARLQGLAERIAQNGFIHPLTGDYIPGSEISIQGGVYREGVRWDKTLSRHRAVLLMLKRLCPGVAKPATFRLYAPEAVTGFARHLGALFPGFIGSEYAPNAPAQARAQIFPSDHQDLARLTFDDNSFDAVVTCDVLEHVPSIDACLAEIHRVLVPGGWHIGTHPFHVRSRTSIAKARIIDGALVHLGAPEYHGNPADPEGGSLVFEVPGWDILERARRAGFSTAQMWFVLDERAAVLSEGGGIYVLCLQH